MKVIGWLGLIFIIIGIIAITFGATVWASKNDKENTWHFVGIGGGLALSIIGIIMVAVGSRGAADAPKGYVKIVVPKIFAANIKYDVDEFYKGGEKPCFARSSVKKSPFAPDAVQPIPA